VIELHAPKAGKGSALAALLPGEDPAGVVCCGDDENDRSMFEYVSSLDIPHMCVGVSSPEAPAHLFDHCDLVVSGPSEAALLLNEIVEWAETASSMAP
jgi:hydroxymethylpyrimidine pyrophosphatase-like HAD family hydrolase